MADVQSNESDEFAAAAARRRALAAQLAAQLATRPVEDVIGVVAASGAGGWSEEGDQWTLSFTLERWRVPPGPIKARPLSVRMTTSRDQFDSLRKPIRANAVIRIRARVVEESVGGTPQAELLELLGLDDSDVEMNQVAIELQTPVVYEDAQFGQFTLDRRVNWYTARIEWNGGAIELTATPDESGSIDGALRVARALWNDQRQWANRITDYAVQELLPLKNGSWLDEDEPEVTADQFKTRMTLESITVEADGSFDFWHGDGDLFWGHLIRISGNLADGPTAADIPG